jgi:serine/threonine-protein kinase PknK
LAHTELLAGRYALQRELGRGASGRVLLALDTAAGDAPRAIKLVGAEQQGRLRWELGVLGAIAHPNLARVYELLRVERPSPSFDLAAGSVALVSELAPGRSASAWATALQRDPQGLLALCVLVADGVARALAALHAHGLLHGDVKPDNVVVDDERASCKLVDLGLASAATMAGAVSGTPGYMAPELWRGERGPSADLYALGATLHHLLRGAPAGDPRSAERSPAEHLRAALRPLSAREPLPEHVPLPLRRLIEELLEPDSALRLGRAAEVSARVAALAEQHGLGSAASVGGGADDAPSAAERALAVTALPFTGHAAALDALVAALGRQGACAVVGPHGSGRSRLVREAVRRIQLARLEADLPVPSYRTSTRLPAGPLGADSVLHVLQGDAVDAAEVAALLCASEVEGRALFLVLERTQPLAALNIAEVTLQPLAEGDVRRLLERALPGARITASMLREAQAVSGGLAGRLCRVLGQALAASADLGRAGSLRALGTAQPDSELRASVPEAARELAEVLAVAGGELGPDAAQAALGSAAALFEAYRALLAAGLGSRSEQRLCLRLDLIAPLRLSLGARVSELAARLPEAELDGRARAHVLVARGEHERALAAFTEEVERLRTRGRAEQAAACAQEGLEVLGALARTEGLRFGLADALRAQGRYADALAALGSAPAYALRAELARLIGDRDQAHALATQALALAAGDGAAAAEAETTLARLCYDAGEVERAESLAEAARTRAGSSSVAVALRAVEVLVLCCLHRGERDRAGALLGPALERARQARLREAEARLTALSGTLARQDGDAHGAARRYAAAFELADAAGEQHAAAAFLHNVGVQRLECGEPGPAVSALRESARRLARLGRDADLGRVLYNLGHAAQLIGQDEIALASAERARDAALRAVDHTTFAYATCLEAELRLKQGERKAVAALLVRPITWTALPTEAVAIVAARLCVLHLGLGEREQAERRSAQAEAAAIEAQSETAQIEHAIARCTLELERGHGDEAWQQAERAHSLAQRGGSFEARLRASLCAARAARVVGEVAVSALRLAEVRSMLDQAARGLSPSERVRLRAVDGYRAALEAVPGQAALTAAHDERWRALAGVAKRLTAERRLPRLYEIVLEAAIELAGAERGYLVLQDYDGRPRVRAGRGLDRRELGEGAPSLSRSIVARVLGSGRALTTVDAASDEALVGAASVHALSLRSVLAVPLRIRGEVAGALYLEDRLRPFAFGELELMLLSDLADLASIALDSARLLRAESRAARRLTALRARLAHKVEAQQLELESLRHARGEEQGALAGIVGHSRAMQPVLAMLPKVARSLVPVLIRGESGTGKELIARALHAQSPRKAAAFVSENCGAIPEPLLESALFGHVRGAFTGADRRHLGLFEVADGGTLLLDEIGEMSPAMQARLLRVLQDGEVRPVGGEQSRKVDVRVLCATHRDLEAMVAQGQFREDLYYRLAVVVLTLPPLRDRPEDLAPLIAHFVDKHAQGRAVQIDRRALTLLDRYGWPGNVRQLENEIRRALVLADEVILPEHLSPALLDATGTAAKDPLDLRTQVDHLERKLIRQALESCGGNQSRAARVLGVSRYGLQKMMRRLELSLGDGLS